MRFTAHLIFTIVLSLYASMSYSKEAAIAARINNQVITLQELEDRIWFIKKFSPEVKGLSKKSLTYNTLEELIEESMIQQEAQRVGLEISDKEFQKVLEQIKYGQAKLYKKIKKSRNPKLANQIFEKKIKTNLIWSKIISEVVKPSVKNINKAQIIEILEQLDKETKEYQFNISQISINKTPDNKILIDKIYNELKNDEETAQILEEYRKQNILFDFLDIGWVSKSDLDKKIYQKLINSKNSTYTTPLAIKNSYIIFRINESNISDNISDQDYQMAQNKIYNSLKISDGKGFLRNLKRRTFIEIYKNRINKALNL